MYTLLLVENVTFTYLCGASFVLFFLKYTSTKTTDGSQLKAEADMRIQLPSNKSDIKEICKNCKTMLLSH